MAVNPATASLYAVNPLPRVGVATLFMTHPPIEERVTARARARRRGDALGRGMTELAQ